jgi:hypothetical protein
MKIFLIAFSKGNFLILVPLYNFLKKLKWGFSYKNSRGIFHSKFCGSCQQQQQPAARAAAEPRRTARLLRLLRHASMHELLLAPGAWQPKKAYTAAAHFGKTNFGRNSAEKREGPKPGVEPLFFGICRETFHSKHTKNR